MGGGGDGSVDVDDGDTGTMYASNNNEGKFSGILIKITVILFFLD